MLREAAHQLPSSLAALAPPPVGRRGTLASPHQFLRRGSWLWTCRCSIRTDGLEMVTLVSRSHTSLQNNSSLARHAPWLLCASSARGDCESQP